MNTLPQSINPADLIASLREHEAEVGEVAKADLANFERFALSETFVVAIIGEFKRGKSTLLNALLGQSLLPTDVTPTTATINVIRFSQEPVLIVHHADGKVEPREFSQAALWEFTAEADFDPDTLDYIEIGLPSPLLASGMVLVDTPGVNDLNEHRSEIAYRFLPRSDAAIFLLSATHPFTKSEKDFLQTNVLGEGLSKIAFVVNFADELDEDEPESVVAGIRNRLAPVVGTSDPLLFLASASVANEARERDDTELWTASGVATLEEHLRSLASNEERRAAKEARIIHRASATAKAFVSDLEQRIALGRQTVESLTEELHIIQVALDGKAKRMAALDEWLSDREAEVLAMTRKSLLKFKDDTREIILEAVESYHGSDFKVFIESELPKRVKQYCKFWIESHAAPLSTLLAGIDNQVVTALGEEFEEVVLRLRPEKELRIGESNALRLEADDVSKTPLRSGLIAGGAAGLLILMTGGTGTFLLPVIGMAGLPFLSKAMTEQHIAHAKQKLRPQLTEALDAALEGFGERVVAAVSENIAELRSSAEERYEELLAELKGRVDAEIASRRATQGIANDQTAGLEERVNRLNILVREWETAATR